MQKASQQQRSDFMSQQELTYRPFADALANSFVNGRGELCHNLDTSRSKVAEEVKNRRAKEQKVSDLYKEVRTINKQIREIENQIAEARKCASRMQTQEERIPMYITVSSLEKERQGFLKMKNARQREISQLKRR